MITSREVWSITKGVLWCAENLEHDIKFYAKTREALMSCINKWEKSDD